MDQFDILVQKQVEVMGKLINLQSEVEKWQHIEKKLQQNEKDEELTLLTSEILTKKETLKELQKQFDFLTEEVIKYFQNKEQINQLSIPQ